MRQALRVRTVVAVLGAVLLAGCSGTPAPGPADPHNSGAADGPWRAWVTSLSPQEASGTCGATEHQVVCSTAPDGLVGRSRVTGAVTWTVAGGGGGGKNGGLVVDAADERAVTSGGRVLRTADLRTGTAAWTHRLPSGRSYTGTGAASGVVYALDTRSGRSGDGADVALGAFRASDGATLWHRAVDADPGEGIAAFGGRVYTTDGAQVTARDARTGDAVATSPPGTTCPHLVSGGRYLVCTGSPVSAEDTFPPPRRLDPATLRPLRTAAGTGMRPARGLISSDGVLMLYEDSAEDPGAGAWTAYDLEHPRRLWSYATTTEEGGLAGGRFVTLTPGNDTSRGRVISIDLHTGPDGAGAAAPRLSAPYPQTRSGEHPALIVPGGGSGHVVVEPRTHRALRSVRLP
ncbi:PQQ-binding-like beta-propeller repeat protein [Streptomyces sp. S.PNR 29]|uniref:outer membrane protein assembly factor BamB family protein n=1 Tax=Streptomyces sp. S.PNR 29 TaxID=2973805 RepID=UPI0025AF75DB|nr:PQQ-binding-like beta-propeller repeat protein [Streptomyces sp. S.PNR 29]MDN0194395.1 PQQ-like beta-propeller repeat protein [Streptomyces sp. S.PNR 29]